MKINIYGTARNALIFYLSNRNVEVNKFIESSLSSEDTVNINFFNHKESCSVISLMHAEQDLKKYYTVVATSEISYWEIKKILEALGLTEFENFEFCATFQKKIAITFGNCNAHGVATLLSSNPHFFSEYGFYPVQPTFELFREGISVKEQMNDSVLQRASLFLYQDIRLNNQYGTEYETSQYIKKLNSSCRCICVPNYVKMPAFLFPQSQYLDINPILDFNNMTRNIVSPFTSKDCYIDQYYQNRTLNFLTDLICKKDFIDHHYILDLFDEFVEKLENREHNCEIKTSNFILANFKKCQLFYDLRHPSRELLSFIAVKILNLLGITNHCDTTENFVVRDCLPVSGGGRFVELDCDEVPIYLSVFKTFNFTFERKLLHRSYIRNDSFHHVISVKTVEGYIKDYVLWNYGKQIS